MKASFSLDISLLFHHPESDSGYPRERTGSFGQPFQKRVDVKRKATKKHSIFRLKWKAVAPADIPPVEILEKITREIGANYALPLFGVDRDRGVFCGSGTLVALSGRHYILTAAHVWTQLQTFPMVGMSLKEGVSHRFLLETWTIDASKTMKPRGSLGAWGPDLSLLRIPPNKVGEIKARMGFYNLAKCRALPRWPFDTWILLGAAREHGVFSAVHADLIMKGFFMIVEVWRRDRQLDYLEGTADLRLPGVPRSFDGVSGAGIWRVRYTRSGNQFSWWYRLEGVAIYQGNVVRGKRFIRGHGMKAVASLVVPARIFIPRIAGRRTARRLSS